MKKLIAIGEALIDFIPSQTGCGLGEVESFCPRVGGAPANVCGAFAKLGGKAAMITQLGKDAFGDKIIKELEDTEIDVSYITRTEKANTCLAFVSLKEDGDREFSFYRNPSADILLEPESIQKSCFTDAFGLHFCSVSLGEYPMEKAHKKAIEYALENQLLLSFDPNVRLPLWKDHKQLKKKILEYIPYAHVLKITAEELEFMTGYKSVEEAKDILFQGNVKLVVETRGAFGARAYTKTIFADVSGKKVKAIDTTGAGDAFIGSFLAQLAKENIDYMKLEALTAQQLKRYLDYSNQYCAYSVMRKGAIASYATELQMKQYLK